MSRIPLTHVATGSALLATTGLVFIWGMSMQWMPLFLLLLPLLLVHGAVTVAAVVQARAGAPTSRRVNALLGATSFGTVVVAVLPLFGRSLFALLGLMPANSPDYWFAESTFAANLPILAAWVGVAAASLVQAGASLGLLATEDTSQVSQSSSAASRPGIR